jgi:histidine phosphotransferase ChpT
MDSVNAECAAPEGAAPAPPPELAARLASMLCHDFINSAGAIISGVDLMEDPAAVDLRDDAMGLIASSARKLVDLISFARLAYGAASGMAEFDGGELERLARGFYAHVKADLEWAAPAQPLPKAVAQVMLNFAQLAAGALPVGGTARVRAALEAGAWEIEAIAHGRKARLHAEVAAGLEGEPLGDGAGGRWAPAAYVRAVAEAAGGRVWAAASEETVTFCARLP